MNGPLRLRKGTMKNLYYINAIVPISISVGAGLDRIRCLHSPDIKAIRARRMLKDQLRAAHTTPPSHNGRQASSRRPCCHKESAVVSRLPDLAGPELTE